MIKPWTFDFCKDEGHIVITPKDQDVDYDIRDAIQKGDAFVSVPLDDKEVYINLSLVKLIVRGDPNSQDKVTEVPPDKIQVLSR